MAHTNGTRSLNITLLTVCIDAEAVANALDAAESRAWAVSEISFDAYISAKRRPHFGDHLKTGDGCVAIIDFDQNPKQAVEAAAFVQQAFPERIVVIAVCSDDRPQMMMLAMHAGCTEFLKKPFDESALVESFRRAEQHFALRNAVSSMGGSILAFFGAKGGVGTTTLAIHLATFLARNEQKKVLLIDNHTQFGHACIYLGLDSAGVEFAELVRNVNRLDSELLSGFTAVHSSGLRVLSSPDVGQTARPMHADDVSTALEFLRTEFDFVLVDCSDSLDGINSAVIAAASQVYVVATPEISAVRDLSRYADELVRVDESTTQKIRVVINRYSSQFAVSLEEIEKAIRLPVSFNIPNSYIELVRSANLGIPLTPDNKAGFCTELTRWAASLIGVSPSTTPSATETLVTARTRRSLKATLSALMRHQPEQTRKVL